MKLRKDAIGQFSKRGRLTNIKPSLRSEMTAYNDAHRRVLDGDGQRGLNGLHRQRHRPRGRIPQTHQNLLKMQKLNQIEFIFVGQWLVVDGQWEEVGIWGRSWEVPRTCFLQYQPNFTIIAKYHSWLVFTHPIIDAAFLRFSLRVEW